jgi:hypothetical protein
VAGKQVAGCRPDLRVVVDDVNYEGNGELVGKMMTPVGASGPLVRLMAADAWRGWISAASNLPPLAHIG